MAIPVSAIHGARQEAELAKRQARPDAQTTPARHQLWLGVVKAQQAGTTYQVDVINDAGAVAATYDYVREVPASPSALPVNAVVWLLLEDKGERPQIVNTNGWDGLIELGVAMD